jgi:3'-phosphoadenosine 5'-phosphosulfate sulfotransferase (PAPS reductase)/FAD synthetase
MQSWSLERKIEVTQTRIIEWYEKFKGNTYVSFSGGKDSTVLLDLARRIYPDIEAVFIDTGLEYPEVRQFALSQENIIKIKPEMNFKKVIEKYGYPLISKEVSRDISAARNKPEGKTAQKFIRNSDYHKKYGDAWLLEKWTPLKDSNIPISNQCCNVMKKLPAKKYGKASGKVPIIATMACESRLRKKEWLNNGCNAFDKNYPSSQPMSFWTEQDVLLYIIRYEIQYATVYGDILEDKKGKLYTTGCDRTGCVFCAYGCQCEKEPNRFQRLKQTHPKLWEYCMRSVSEGGLGMKEVLEYIGVKYE